MKYGLILRGYADLGEKKEELVILVVRLRIILIPIFQHH